MHRTASPPAPPADWLERLQDHAQVKSLLNGDSMFTTDDTPVAIRLSTFFLDPVVAERWAAFNAGKPRL